MLNIAGVFVVLVAVATAVVAGRYAHLISRVGLLGGGIGAAGLAFLAYGPKDYMIRYPWSRDVFHPYQIALYSFAALAFCGGVLLGLLTRRVVLWLSTRRSART